ncbi:MAG TPA: class I SAM-dependent methyltransferase [Bryobacteraceae bacterium]|nr:class I SAM-dependent methyltransferase [Bryobacteraceae bacterium]
MESQGQPHPEFDGYADRYEELIADPLRDRFAKSAEYFHWRKLEVLRAYLAASGKPPGKLRWLDLGCGRGDLLRIGKAAFAMACGCDVSAESVKYCEGVTVRVQPSDESIPFADGSFDLVTAACVYHHVAAAQRAKLTESARAVLQPGGVFCVFEHNPRNPVTRAIVKRSPVDVNAVLLNADETKSLLRGAGFESIAVHYYLFAPESLGRRAAGFEKWLRHIPLGGQYAAFGTRP